MFSLKPKELRANDVCRILLMSPKTEETQFQSFSPNLSPCLSLYLSPSLSLYLSPHLSPHLSPYLSPNLSPCLSPCLSLYLSPSLSLYLSPNLSPRLSPHLFPHRSQFSVLYSSYTSCQLYKRKTFLVPWAHRLHRLGAYIT